MLSRRHGAVAPLAVGLLAEHLGAGALWVTAMPSVSAFVAFLPAGARGARVGTAKGRYWREAVVGRFRISAKRANREDQPQPE